ncbi:hypothetical protein AAFF_G00245610 [Aldrovandia affinis]|uniref:Uncharacterized protein n=1 Tax=Aldrovandia affinis TaxID=143900 RepID=A0AAD7QZQ4_9TELE|nr:hypothetical protein AAFF_G00245610 [Aldrovandia affinis]
MGVQDRPPVCGVNWTTYWAAPEPEGPQGARAGPGRPSREALNSRPTAAEVRGRLHLPGRGRSQRPAAVPLRQRRGNQGGYPTRGRPGSLPRSKHPEVVQARTRVEEARRSFVREDRGESGGAERRQTAAVQHLWQDQRGGIDGREWARWTFQRPEPLVCGVKLDYILVRRKWRKSILNAESYSTLGSVGSITVWVAARLRLSLRVPKSAPRARPDWEAFGKPELQATHSGGERPPHLLAEEGANDLRAVPLRQRRGNQEMGTRRRGRHRASLGPNTQRLCERTRVEEARRSFVREGTAESQEAERRQTAAVQHL